MENCTVNIANSKVGTELSKLLGPDEILKTTMYLEATSNGSFNDAFVEWYKKTHKDDVPDINTSNTSTAAKIARNIKDYYYSKNASVSASVRKIIKTDSNVIYGYANTSEREAGKRHVANVLLESYVAIQDAGLVIKNNKLNYYLGKVKSSWKDKVFNYAAKLTGKDKADIILKYNEAEDKDAYLDKLLGGKLKSITASNLLAVYRELFNDNDHAIKYINEVFSNNSKLVDVFHEVSDDLDSELNRISTEETDNELGVGPEDDSEGNLQDTDSDAIGRTDHSGIYSSYLSHLSVRIRNYFNTLKKLKSPTVGDFDTNNSYGLPETMDATECVAMIYNNGDFHNTQSFVAKLRTIGETIKGFEAFVQLAADLDANYDLATEMFTNFAKVKIAKVETVIENGKAVTRLSNTRADADSALLFNLFDDIKSTIINNNADVVRTQLNKLYEVLDSASANALKIESKKEPKESKEFSKEIALRRLKVCKEALIHIVKAYFPSIEDSAIIAYVELNNNSSKSINGQITNIYSLLSDIRTIVNNSDTVVVNYNNMLRTAADIDAYNNELRKEEAVNKRWVSPSKYKDKSAILTDDYIDPVKGAVRYITTKLLPFSVVDTNFNNRNVHGKNNSDIINSSHLTNIQKILQDFYIDERHQLRNKTLEAWGADKLKSAQYKYSNLLVEQVDEKTGKVLNKNKALFRYVNGQLCLTENADKILKVRLFNGASNIDDNTAALYAEMTMGDYLPTSFINYFKTSDFDADPRSIATYFLRTPSDASKNFAVRAPRHNTERLFRLKNPEEFKKTVNEIVQKVANPVTAKQWFENYRNPSLTDEYEHANIIYNSEELIDYLVPDSHILISDALSIRKVDPSDESLDHYEGYVSFMTEDGEKLIVLRGTINKAGKGQAIDNAKLEAVVSKSNTDNTINKEIRELLYNYYFEVLQDSGLTIGDTYYPRAELEIDTEHPVFKLMKNQFKQELLDAGMALNHYFEFVEVKDGVYELKRGADENGKTVPVFKSGMGHGKGYDFYHLDKNGKVFVSTKDGIKFGGAVFHSNKFTLLQKDKHGDLYKKNYLDDIINNGNDSINFLYGAALQFKLNSDGEVIDIILNDKHNELIDAALSDFIIDYCEQAYNEVTAYEDFITDVVPNRANIVEYAINQRLMHYMFDDLFGGNTKFYKDSQTILKREKENQASGVPYGIADYSAGFRPSLDTVKAYSYLNSGKTTVNVKEEYVDAKGNTRVRNAKDENGVEKTEEITIQELFNRYGFNIQQRQGFTGVTIYNTQMTNKKALEILRKQLIKTGLTDNEAADLLYGPIQYDDNGDVIVDKETGEPVRRGGYTKTKVNDAQSYITFEEWVRRIAARGQLQRYMPLIKKLIDPNSVINASDIKEFMQVQKNVYYDLYYDSNYGIEVPRFIKNAEYVLLPRLIKGTQLEAVYNAMKEAGIDQLNTKETSKAANEEVLTLWDNESNLTAETVAKFISRAKEVKQIFSYNNLYTQQETPQHMNAQNKAGIQIVKKILDNLPNDGKLGKLKDDFFRLYTTNIAESCERLLKQFDIPVDENGNIDLDENGNIKGIDKKVFYNKLKDELLRLGMDNNAMDYVTIPSDSTEPLMPAYRANLITKFESIVQSLFNSSIIRQKLPGFHAAQVTNVGWSPMNEHIDTVTYDKDLQYHPVQYKEKDKEDHIISWRDYEALPAKEKAKYEKTDPAPYIEVMLPASFLGINRNSPHYKRMTDEEILKEIQAEKLDTIIGYRIPTEGKQSVCIMKVVGILSDANGSTIVVPNDWVSQTGSDFDIDSVYSIQYETYRDKSGRVRRLAYKNSFDKYDWFDYISHIANIYEDEEVSEKIKEAKTKIKENLAKQRRSFDEEEQKIWKSLTNVEQQILDRVNKDIDTVIKREELEGPAATTRRYELLSSALEDLIRFAEQRKNTKAIERAIALKDNIDRTLDFIRGRSETYSERTKKAIDEILENYASLYNDSAKKAGLMTLEEFINPENRDKANGTRRRNSAIFDTMLEILSDPATLEENLSRSNFDDITYWKGKLSNKNVKTYLEGRSPYNPFDQMRYQEEAMSGAKLKAFSVTLDTFCSVCNKVRPTLTKPIYVVYDKNDIDTKKVSKRFGNGVSNLNGFAVRHSMYGWSNDNRNSFGKLLTAYSSQTTAFILDAIKEGSLPNVNDYTFSVFKTLVNTGCDYKTAIGFIMQPGVTEIVNAYNANKSVFSSRYENPIHQAIYNIAEQLGINVYDEKYTFIDVHKPILEVLSKLDKEYGVAFNGIFHQDGDEDITISLSSDKLTNLPIIVSKLVERLDRANEDSSSPVEKRDLLFDLGVVLTYKYIQDSANTIGDYARCCNPDKSGVKQSVFATRQIFKNLQDLLFKTESVTVYDEEGNPTDESVEKPVTPILTVKGKHILASIYPGIDNPEFNQTDLLKHILQYGDIKDSSYPSLFAFLKYASATSVVVSRTLFDTQKAPFVGLVEGLASVFSGYKPQITEEVYNDFQKYVINSFDLDCPAIKYPVKVRLDKKKNIIVDYNVDFDATKPENEDINIIQEERNRIYGYNRKPTLTYYEKGTKLIAGVERKVRIAKEFTVVDINNPTDEELEHFEQLSPAQKVQWIKGNFVDAGIFSFIRASLVNPYQKGKRKGMQALAYTEQNADSNVMYAEFDKAFYNSNPFVVSAAIDLVKYAVQVEGFKMSATAINKVISNSCLYNDFGNEGLGVINHSKARMLDINSRVVLYDDYWNNSEAANKLYENYLRSHSNTKSIKRLVINKKNREKFKLRKLSYGIYCFTPDNTGESEAKTMKAFNARMKAMGIKYYLPLSNAYKTNSYIRLIEDGVSTLYKIHDHGDVVMLTPLAKLEENENALWSANEDNNPITILAPFAYDYIVSCYVDNAKEITLDHTWISSRLKEVKAATEGKQVFYSKRKDNYDKVPALPLPLEELAQKGGSFSTFKDGIIEHFRRPTTERFFAKVRGINQYIFSPGAEYGASSVSVNTPEGVRKFNIFIPADINKYETHFLKNGESIDEAKSQSLKKIVKNAQASNMKRLDEVVEVTPYIEPEEYAPAAAIEESAPVDEEVATVAEEQADLDNTLASAISTTIDYAIGRKSARPIIDVLDNANKPSKRSIESDYIQKLKDHKIYTDINTIKANPEVALRETAKYATRMASYISNDLFDRFIPYSDSIEGFLSITDPEIQKRIAKDEVLLEKYMEAVNTASAFLNVMEVFDKLNIKADNAQTEFALAKIKEAIEKVRKLPIDDVRNKCAQTITDKITTNPLLKDRLIDVFDGYWKSYGSMWRFHSIMENGTPIVQIMLKEIMGDLDAKRMAGLKAKKAYWKRIDQLKKMAAAAGLTIDLNKIIDADGRFIHDYTNEFSEELEKLYSNVQEAIQEHGVGSVEHLTAKIAYDEFKAIHVNQEAIPEYYIRKCAIEKRMLTNYPKLYSAYMTLYYKRLEKYEDARINGMTDEIRKDIRDIDNQIANLRNDFYYYRVIGDFTTLTHRPEYDSDVTYTQEDIDELNFYGKDAVQSLNTTIRELSELNEETFEYKSAYGFEEQVKMYQSIIIAYERPDANGIPTVPLEILEQNEKYVEAKDWFAKNARFEFDLDEDASGNKTGLKDKLEGAFRRLGLAGKAKPAYLYQVYKEFNESHGNNDGRGIKDEKGIPDGRKLVGVDFVIPGINTPNFTSPEKRTPYIERVKSAQRQSFYGTQISEDLDLTLLSNANPNPVIYNKAFYNAMSGDGRFNVEYNRVVTELNSILEKYISNEDGNIHFEDIEDTEEGIAELEHIAELYQKLRNINKKIGSTNNDKIKDFIDEKVEFKVNTELWISQNTKAEEKSDAWFEAWCKIAYERKKDGSFVQVDGEFVPNQKLYTYAKPKGELGEPEHDVWIDTDMQEDTNLINKVYKTVSTKYYTIALREAQLKAQTDNTFDFKQWYTENHIYNPYTRRMEPIDCWVTKEVRTELFTSGQIKGGKWVPRGNQRERVVKDGITTVMMNGSEMEIEHPSRDKVNHYYKPNAGLRANYIVGSDNGKYDSKQNLNEYEQEMLNFLEDTLAQTATTEQSRTYFSKGFLPRSKKPETPTIKKVGREAGKLVGIGITNNNKDNVWYREIGYEFDRTPNMPMTKLLENKQTIDLHKKLKEIKDRVIPEDDPNYEDRVKEQEQLIKDIEDQIRKERQSILDRDWYNVIDCYLDQACRYNAILDNKQKLYFLHGFLKDMKMYSRSKGFTGKLAKDWRKDSTGNTYEKTVDKDLIEQLENYMRRLMFDQWKENEGMITSFMNNLQTFASADYMMLNVRGGIANITLGESGIIGEAIAKEFFHPKDWAFGTNEWIKGSIGFARSGYHQMFNNNDIAFNKQDAIIKYMAVWNYDGQTGVVTQLSLEEYSKKLRDLMFSPQTIGEHFMQNSVMFAMMHSHKLIRMPGGEYTYMSKEQYIRHRFADVLEEEILTPEQVQAFKEFKDALREDKDELADYAWFRKDALTEFINSHLTDNQLKTFIDKRKKQEKKFEKEFEEKDSIYDQLELGSDGKMKFKEGSILEDLDRQNSYNAAYVRGELVTEADKLLGRFAEKCRRVNDKIHGVYNDLGSAYIEKLWFGGIVMQYHKHLPMGLLKRYMARGHYNETRGTVDKGMVQSIIDIASLNLRRVKANAGLTDTQLGALEGLVFMITHAHNIIGQLRTTMQIIPPYEKANLLRNSGDLIGTVAAMLAVAVLWYIADDDKEMQDSLWFNVTLYEADRLASEAFMYNPWGLLNESKKLMSTPVAAQSILEDAASSLKAVSDWIFDDEFDPYYQTGRFAGEPKLWVYIQRRTPIWNGIRGILDTPSNNHYYKLGENPLGFFDIKEHVTEDDK